MNTTCTTTKLCANESLMLYCNAMYYLNMMLFHLCDCWLHDNQERGPDGGWRLNGNDVIVALHEAYNMKDAFFPFIWWALWILRLPNNSKLLCLWKSAYNFIELYCYLLITILRFIFLSISIYCWNWSNPLLQWILACFTSIFSRIALGLVCVCVCLCVFVCVRVFSLSCFTFVKRIFNIILLTNYISFVVFLSIADADDVEGGGGYKSKLSVYIVCHGV